MTGFLLTLEQQERYPGAEHEFEENERMRSVQHSQHAHGKDLVGNHKSDQGNDHSSHDATPKRMDSELGSSSSGSQDSDSPIKGKDDLRKQYTKSEFNKIN